MPPKKVGVANEGETPALAAVENESALGLTTAGISTTAMPLPDAPVVAPPVEEKKAGRGAGKRLTDKERLEILDLFEKGASVSNAEIARRYGITRAAIQKLKLKGPEVKARYRHGSTSFRDERKRGSHSVSVPFEKELFEWVRGLKARKVPVPPSLVKEKAKLLVPKYNLGDFQASNGWYYNFCKRFNLTTGVLVDEKADIDQERYAEELLNNSSSSNTKPPQNYLLPVGTAVGANAASTLSHQSLTEQSKSDKILDLLAKQAELIERQTQVSEEQSETIKKLLEFLVAGRSSA